MAGARKEIIPPRHSEQFKSLRSCYLQPIMEASRAMQHRRSLPREPLTLRFDSTWRTMGLGKRSRLWNGSSPPSLPPTSSATAG